MLERCTRIWCVLPVPMRTSSSVNLREPAQHAIFGPGGAAAQKPCGHARAMPRIAGDGPLDAPALCFHNAVDQGEVDFLHLPPGKLGGQGAVRRVVFGHQQHAAGEAVQTMHDARPQRPTHAGQAPETGATARSPACRNERPRRHAPPCRRVYRWPPGRCLRKASRAGWLRLWQRAAPARRVRRRSGRPREPCRTPARGRH